MITPDIDILLVEDNPTDVELILRALRQHNHADKVFVVKDGHEAMDFIHAVSTYAGLTVKPFPKLILLDLKLPGMSGLEVLQSLKADEQLKSIPVVMFTSSAQEVDIEECYRLGVNSYIQKPVEYNKFVNIIGEVGMYWLSTNVPPVKARSPAVPTVQ